MFRNVYMTALKGKVNKKGARCANYDQYKAELEAMEAQARYSNIQTMQDLLDIEEKMR